MEAYRTELTANCSLETIPSLASLRISHAAPCTDLGDIRDCLDVASENENDDGDQPPSKRRKLSEKQAESVRELEELWRNAITVASLNLHLTFPYDTCVGSKSEKQPGSCPVILSLAPFVIVDNTEKDRDLSEYRLNTLDKSHKSALKLDRTAPFLAKQILQLAVLIGSSSNKSRLARTECVLRRKVSDTEAPSYAVEVTVRWRNAANMGEYTTDKECSRMLELLFSSAKLEHPSNWSPRDFYESVYIPPQKGPEADKAQKITVDGLSSKLYPFQKRTTQWMLQREGVDVEGNIKDASVHASRHGFSTVTGIDGRKFYVNPWLGLVTDRAYIVEGQHTQTRGGLLAEEMGLGKTVEIVSLILLHKRDSFAMQQQSQDSLTKSAATLIVSPVSIQQQWFEEIQTHAPGLKVLIYDGVKSLKDANNEEMVKTIVDHDIVLCSYTVLSSEIHYAETEPDRVLRHKRQYEKRKSPLVQIDWWRCVLDECQMVESGVSQAARVVNQIPRQNAWAASGTPLKKDATDLLGLLIFLRIEPYCYSQKLFQRLMKPEFRYIFKDLWQQVALRHSKEQIKDELELPRQNRFVVTMPFTQIEEQHYANMYQEMCEDCELSIEGAPLKDDWNPNDSAVIEKMRTWLARLRQTVLHPEVGERNRRALGQSEGPLRTVEEVLKVMTEQNEASMRQEERNWLSSKLRRGQIIEHAKRPEEALRIWLEVVDVSTKALNDCRKAYEKAANEEKTKNETRPPGELTEDSDEEMKGAHTHLGSLRARVRGDLEILHTATFFVANAYYQIKTDENLTKPGSDRFQELEKLEVATYDEAKVMRKEMLTETQARANVYMERIKKRKFVDIPDFKELMAGGIESRDIVDKATLLTDIMNTQAEKLDEWRGTMIKLLLLPLIDQEEAELQGDEYETSTKQQDEQYVYHEILRATTADRADFLTGQENGLIKRDMAIALSMARRDEGASPGLMIKLLEERQPLTPRPSMGHLRGIVLELRSLRTVLESYGTKRAQQETAIINEVLSSLQPDVTEHAKIVSSLEREVDLFRDAMNARLDFYRQLQSISDAVAPYEEELSENEVKKRISSMQKEEDRLEAKMNTFRSRGRYLDHLKDESNTEDGPRRCIICQDNIEVGVLLSCGHQFCKDCLREWYSTHRTCPVCKKKLSRTDFHQITYKPLELTAQEEIARPNSQKGLEPNVDVAESAATTLYTGLNSRTLSQIKGVDLPGSFGTKIDTLARHIIWLRASDPGAKSIVFSQFRDFLGILARAFKRFKIGFTTIDERTKGIERFKKDSSVECFFLHARAHSSGLNLVNATHVFLAEPLVNTALELQAIARVHRIGQHHQTSVYMYLVEDTVEKAIYDMSVERRMAHISKARQRQQGAGKKSRRIVEDDVEKANSMELQEASAVKMLTAGRGGGELVDKSDLWDCLFGVKAAGRAKLSDDVQRSLAGFLR